MKKRPLLAVLFFLVCGGACSWFAPAIGQMGRLGDVPNYEGPGDTLTTYRSILLDDPRIRVGPGRKAVVTFETSVPTPPAVCAYGLLMPDQTLRIPDYCQEAFEEAEEEKDFLRSHEIILNLERLEIDRCDLDGALRSSGGAAVYFELEIYDPRSGVAAALPYRFAYRGASRVPCMADGPWVDIVGPREAIISWGVDVPASGSLRYVVSAGGGASTPPGDAVMSPDEPLDAPPNYKAEMPFGSASRQTLTITDLWPGALCEYSICLVDPAGHPDSLCYGPYSFSMPTPHGAFCFALMGDSRSSYGSGEKQSHGVNLARLRLFCKDAHARGASFILFSGDLVNGATTSPQDLALQLGTWKRGVDIVSHRLCFYETMGNHEMCRRRLQTPHGRVGFDRPGEESAEAVFASLFSNPLNGPAPESAAAPPYTGAAYHFTWGRSLFIVVNNNYWYCSHPEDLGGNLDGYIMDVQMAWIRGLLETAAGQAGIDHVFVMLHEPAFPCGGHAGDAMWHYGGDPGRNRTLQGRPLDRSYVVERRDEFWRALAECGKVRALLAGHEHNYSRLLVTAETPVYPDGSSGRHFVNPVWQCVSGGAGAPHYPRSRSVPWVDHVAAFSAQNHYVMVCVSGGDVALFAISDALLEFDGCLLVDGYNVVADRPMTLARWRDCGYFPTRTK